jgi:hypothetical protein
LAPNINVSPGGGGGSLGEVSRKRSRAEADQPEIHRGEQLDLLTIKSDAADSSATTLRFIRDFYNTLRVSGGNTDSRRISHFPRTSLVLGSCDAAAAPFTTITCNIKAGLRRLDVVKKARKKGDETTDYLMDMVHRDTVETKTQSVHLVRTILTRLHAGSLVFTLSFCLTSLSHNMSSCNASAGDQTPAPMTRTQTNLTSAAAAGAQHACMPRPCTLDCMASWTQSAISEGEWSLFLLQARPCWLPRSSCQAKTVAIGGTCWSYSVACRCNRCNSFAGV